MSGGDHVSHYMPVLASAKFLVPVQAFVADCTAHFHRMQKKQSWADTDYRNGAEAMAAILEVMRRHEVRRAHRCAACGMTSLQLQGYSNSQGRKLLCWHQQ